MKDKSCGYRVLFSIDKVSLKQQLEVYNLLKKHLSFDLKDHLHITVEDPVGGKHYVWDDTGVNPKGEFCKECLTISCEFCHKYENKEGKDKWLIE